MNKFLILLTFLHFALAASITMGNALRNQVVIDFKNAIVPIISKQIEHIVLQDIHGKQNGVEYWITKIHIYVNAINPAQINIEFISPSTLRFTGTSLSMRGTATAKAKWTIFQKTVSVEIGIKNAGISTSVILVPVNNKPNIRITEFKLGISSGNVHIKISGGLIGKIIDLLVNVLKPHIVKNVVSAVQSKVPPLVARSVNDKLNTLPNDIKVSDKIFMKYSFPNAPAVKSGYLVTGIVAYLYPAGDPRPPPGPIAPMPEIDHQNSKGVQFFLSDFVVRSGLNTAFKLNLMSAQVNTKVDNRPISMKCLVTKLPDFKFANAIKASADGTCTVSLDNDPKPKFEVILSIGLELSEKVKNAILFFNAEKLQLIKVDFKKLVDIDIEWFKKKINDVMAAVLAAINGELGQKGIPLPTIKEVDYSDIIQYVSNGYTMIGTTPIFRFKMEGEPIILYASSEEAIVDDELLEEHSEY